MHDGSWVCDAYLLRVTICFVDVFHSSHDDGRDLRDDGIAQRLEPWLVALRLCQSTSVHPCGYPIIHSAKFGRNFQPVPVP